MRTLLAGLVLFYLAIWIVFPAPAYWLLPFGIGAPELSPLLFGAALVLGIVAVRSPDGMRFLAVMLVLATMLLAAVPVAQVPSTRSQFDTEMEALPPAPPPDPSLDTVSITRGIVFAEPATRPLTLDLYRPVSERLFPVVIQIYGGAWREGTPGDDARFASALARQGYLVVAIDYRHAPESRWPAQLDDVRAGLEWVIAHAGEYGGDPRHVALLGRSSGAQLALIEAYTEPARVEAVVAFYAPTNLAEGWKSPPSPDPLPVRPVLEAFLGGTPDDVPELYAAASPISYVGRRVPPTLLIYGARDHIVEARFGRELHAKLKAAGASSTYLEVPWAEHAFDKVPGLGARVTQPYVERFLAAHLR